MVSTKSAHPTLPSLLQISFGLMSFIKMQSDRLLLKFFSKNFQISASNSLTKFQTSLLQCLKKFKLIIACLRETYLSFCSLFHKSSKRNPNFNKKKRNICKRALRKCPRPNPWLISFPKTPLRNNKNLRWNKMKQIRHWKRFKRPWERLPLEEDKQKIFQMNFKRKNKKFTQKKFLWRMNWQVSNQFYKRLKSQYPASVHQTWTNLHPFQSRLKQSRL